MVRRGRVEIIRDILECTKKGSSKSTIRHCSYLDYRTFKKYFDWLIKCGFIQDGNTYQLTQKGSEFLEESKKVFQRLREEELRI